VQTGLKNWSDYLANDEHENQSYGKSSADVKTSFLNQS